MELLIWLGLFAPLVGFLTLLLSSHYISRLLSGCIACGVILFSFLCFGFYLTFYNQMGMPSQEYILYNWIPIKNIQASFSVFLDPLSLLMTLIITGIGFLIHLYSYGYMEHEEDFARYFSLLNFFIFCMLLLVLSSHLLLLFVGWEGVGLASYLLIGFWYTRPAAAEAATKAFVVNRIGDLGFLLGLLLTFQIFGTGNIVEVSQMAASQFPIGASILTLLCVLYFIGCTGKSAQIPLQTWLPDAMEGPTPVSALIHAATMVTAGVYLIVRMHPVFLQAPDALMLVAIIGTLTAFYAAWSALGQTDLKKVLAYSTVSQLGYMFLACGVGAFYAAMFHLTTHAFVKALLFLSAGNVVHMMHGSTNMEKMGGLDRKLPKTRWFFLIGALAMAGIPPLAAFFSKDLILDQAHLMGFNSLFVIGLLTTLLTGFYLIRAYCMTFLGLPRIEEKILKMVHEAPNIMLGPIAILALLSVVGGFLGYAFGYIPILERFLSQAKMTLAVDEPLSFTSLGTWLSIIAAIIGVVSAYIIYTRYANRLGKPSTILRKSFYFDEIYEILFVKPLKAISNFIVNFSEPKIFEGSILETGKSVQHVASFFQKMQSGQIRSYVAWMAIGMVVLIIILIT